MDFPEVWHFKVKQKALKHETFPSNDAVALKLTSKLPVVKMLSILLPEADTSQLLHIIKDSDYYSTENFKLSEIFTRSFIDGFLKTGKFSCSPVDYPSSEATFAITNNKLIIRLHKDSLYSSSPIELSNFKKKHLDEGEISTYEINLLQDKLELSKLKAEIQDLVSETAVNLMWSPHADDVCPSSIAKYFSDNDHNIKLCKNKLLDRPEYGLKFPTITDDEYCFPEISEYIGMVLLGCNVEETDFSSYKIPNESVEIGRGKVIHCKGFIVQRTIQQVIDEARNILSKNSSFPWIALSLILPETSSKLFLITKDKVHSL